MLLADVFFIIIVVAIGATMMVSGLVLTIDSAQKKNLRKAIMYGFMAMAGIMIPCLGLPVLYGIA